MSPVAVGYTIPWLEENIKQATVGTNGLEYTQEFLSLLNKLEAEADAAIKRLSQLTSDDDMMNQIPRKQNGELY